MATALQVAEVTGVFTITMDSPGNRNALSRQMRAELRAAFDAAAASPTARVVVLTHTGPVFCAGMDLKETAGIGDGARDGSAGDGSAGVRELPGILQRIARCPQPVLARVNGAARAGGIGMLAAADIVVAVESATFAFSEVRIGLIPAVISVPVLRRVAPAVAAEFMLTGSVFDAATAHRIGLVNRIAAPDRIDDVMRVFLDDLRKGGPTALAGTKQMLLAGHDDSDERYELLLETSAQQFSSGEGRHGAFAFVEKRSPDWTLE